MCRDEFLHFLRIREWQDLHAQLRQIARELELDRNAGRGLGRRDPHRRADRAAVPRRPGRAGRETVPGPAGAGPAAPSARTAGIPRRPRHEVRDQPRLERGQGPATAGDGGRDRRDHPAVGPDRRADHRRTGRGGRRAPAQAELLRAALVGPGRFGGRGRDRQPVRVPIIAGRRVGYGKINPVEAREIFIRSALVEGQWRTRHEFFAANAGDRGPRPRNWRSGPGAATSWSTTGDLRLLRRADPGRGRLRRALRRAGGATRRGRPRTCSR